MNRSEVAKGLRRSVERADFSVRTPSRELRERGVATGKGSR